MKWRAFKIRREPGFRLNLTDLLFIALLVGLAGVIYQQIPASTLHWLPLYLGMSFFLFCNLFRIGNRLEIVWYLPFILFAGQGVYRMDLEIFWRIGLPVLEIIKWGLIVYRIRRGPYVGIGYGWLARFSRPARKQ